MNKYAVLALCFLLVFQGVTELIVISRATDYSVWRYHKILTITNSTALPVGYQLNFTLWKGVGVDSAGNFYLNNHANDNLYDLRFVDGNGVLLDMWNQTNIVGETHVHTWIELASSLVVVMYYGNEYASSEWDTAADVFDVIVSGVDLVVDVNGWTGAADGVGPVGVPSITVNYVANYTVGAGAGANWRIHHSYGGSPDDWSLSSYLAYNYWGAGGAESIRVRLMSGDGGFYVDYADDDGFNSKVYALASLNSWGSTENLNSISQAELLDATGGGLGTYAVGKWVLCNLTGGEATTLTAGYVDVEIISGYVVGRGYAEGVSTSSTAETDVQATDVTTEQDVNWMAFIVLLAFAFLNVLLMLVPRFYVLNFVVGALTLAFSAATVNDSTLPIQPYFSLIVALLSVLGILRAANLLRNS